MLGLSKTKTNDSVKAVSFVSPSLARQINPVFLSGQRIRNFAWAAATISACALWFFSLGKLGLSAEALPWYITTAAIGLCSARFLKFKPQQEPIGFAESFTGTYLSAAIIIFAFSFFVLVDTVKNTKQTKQIVDIQLVSVADAQNKQSPLPGTPEKENLRQRKADRLTVQGNPLSKVMPANIKQAPAPPASKPNSKTSQNETHLTIPNSWSTKSFSAVAPFPTQKNLKTSLKNDPYISEVEPPELVELIENDGDKDAMHIFQPGGQSSGGKGAENDLSQYLKALHKLIKSNWSPPQGTSRQTEVLFRLKRDGHLASIKVTKSSQDQIIDESAMRAVVAATRQLKPLPKEYRAAYLDIAYVFRYNVNELKELDKED